MADAVEKKADDTPTETSSYKDRRDEVRTELRDDVRESAKAGQQAATDALRKFRDTVNEVVPEAMQPLRDKLVGSALELADKLVSVQYDFHRNLIQTADRALNRPDEQQK